MRLVIRTNGGPQIGGGHVMRCQTLAGEAARRDHDVQFVVGEGPMAERVRDVRAKLRALVQDDLDQGSNLVLDPASSRLN
ncbi:MAG: hypothetical protein KJP02_11460 [Octadecabacter sp.]|nr:hypothetical protein [Octadecabacter sp.]